MLAAIDFLKKRGPYQIFAAVPTGSYNTIQMIAPSVDSVLCLNIREEFPYVVAEAYRNWNDLSDEDVLQILEGVHRKT